MYCDGIFVVKKCFLYVYCKLCFLIILGVKGWWLLLKFSY